MLHMSASDCLDRNFKRVLLSPYTFFSHTHITWCWCTVQQTLLHWSLLHFILIFIYTIGNILAET